MKAELSREGRYILTTNFPDISPEELVAHHKELSDIEAGFREFKDLSWVDRFIIGETTAFVLTSSSPRSLSAFYDGCDTTSTKKVSLSAARNPSPPSRASASPTLISKANGSSWSAPPSPMPDKS